MHRHHFVHYLVHCQDTINQKNTLNRFVIVQTLIDILHAARIQRNSTRKQNVTFFEKYFFEIHTFFPCKTLLRLG